MNGEIEQEETEITEMEKKDSVSSVNSCSVTCLAREDH